MKKFFMLIVALTMILFHSTSFAREILIEASGKYVMDSRLDETTASATARAREEAKRAAVEKAGVYIQEYSKMINFELVEDEVESIAARFLKIQSESSNVEVIENNLLKFTVTIKALVDDLSDSDLKSLIEDRKSLEESARKYKELKEEYDALKNQMEKFKRDYNAASENQKVEIKKEVARNTENFSALGAMSRGNDFYFAKNYGQALTAYSEAIKLNSQLAEAYNNRGIVNYELKNFSAAVADYSTALKLKSNFGDALNNRGNTYATLGQLQNAAQDLQAALKLDDNSATGHNNLGNVHYSMKNFDAAIKEYTRAIQLNPNFAEAYYNRAVTYYLQGNLIQSLTDMKKARELKSNDEEIKVFLEKISRKIG